MAVNFQAQEAIGRRGAADYSVSSQGLRENVPGQLGHEEAPAHARPEDPRLRRVWKSLRREFEAQAASGKTTSGLHIEIFMGLHL